MGAEKLEQTKEQKPKPEVVESTTQSEAVDYNIESEPVEKTEAEIIERLTQKINDYLDIDHSVEVYYETGSGVEEPFFIESIHNGKVVLMKDPENPESETHLVPIRDLENELSDISDELDHDLINELKTDEEIIAKKNIDEKNINSDSNVLKFKRSTPDQDSESVDPEKEDVASREKHVNHFLLKKVSIDNGKQSELEAGWQAEISLQERPEVGDTLKWAEEGAIGNTSPIEEIEQISDNVLRIHTGTSVYELTYLGKEIADTENSVMEEESVGLKTESATPSVKKLERSEDNLDINPEKEDMASEETIEEPELTPEMDDAEIYKKFETDFTISSEALNKIDDFAELPTEKKAFVLHNLKQTAFQKVQAESISRFRSTKSDSNFAKRMWLGFTKGHQLNKEKKAITEEIFNGEVDQTETLTALTEMIKNGPDVSHREDGSFVVHFASEKDFDFELSNTNKEQLTKFNEAAVKFKNVPRELKNGNPEQIEEYEKYRDRYETSRQEVLNLLEENGMPPAEVLAYANSMDQNLLMNQFISSNPQVENELMSIENNRVTTQTIKDILNYRKLATSKGGIALGGFALRSFSTGLMTTASLAIAPITGAAMGAWRGSSDAKDNIAENEVLARSGEKWKSKELLSLSLKDSFFKDGTDKNLESSEARNITDATTLTDKLESLIKEVEKDDIATLPSTRLRDRLHARIAYTEKKIHDDLIDFGVTAGQRTKQLKLLQTLGQAKSYDELPRDSSELERRMKSVLSIRTDRINQKQNQFVNKHMVEGATLGAGFAFAGAALANYLDSSTTETVPADRLATEEELATLDTETETPEDPAPTVTEPTINTGENIQDKIAQLPQEERDMLARAITPKTHESPNIETTPEPIPQPSEGLVSDTNEILNPIPEATDPADLGDPSIDPNSPHGEMLTEQTDWFTNERTDPRVESLIAELNETPTYDVNAGDNIWKIIENKLEAHDLFHELEEGQRTHMIDALKDKIANLSEAELKEFGISSGNPDLLSTEDVLNFQMILDEGSLESAIANAEDLSAAEITQIEKYTPPAIDQAADLGSDNRISVSPDSEQGRMLLDQISDMEEIGMTRDEVILHRTEGIIDEDLHRLYGSDGVLGLFGTRGVDSMAWEDLQDRTVTEVLEKEDFEDTDLLDDEEPDPIGFDSEEAVQKAQNYLQTIMEQSGLTVLPEETMQDYIYRAVENTVEHTV